MNYIFVVTVNLSACLLHTCLTGSICQRRMENQIDTVIENENVTKLLKISVTKENIFRLNFQLN